MPVKKVNFDVKSFIQALNLSSFSLSQLNKAYLKHEACAHSNAKASRQYLYRNIKVLEKERFLSSVKKAESKTFVYHLINPMNTQPIEDFASNEETTLSSAQICQSLREKLKRSKLSLLTSIGETEAYKECVAEMPTLQTELQSMYNDARDNTSKLLGKVNAYESLLTLYESNAING